MTLAVPLLLAFLLACTLLPAEAAQPTHPPPSTPSSLSPSPSPSPTPSCTDELVVFSPCLSYVSSPPNNLSSAASPNCCNVFTSAESSGAAVCFCYLLREPPILGFPLNRTRLLSLSSVCPAANSRSARASSLDSLCSEPADLPPLNKSATFGLTAARGRTSPGRNPPKGNGGGESSTGKGGGSSGIIAGGANLHHSSPTPQRICTTITWLQLTIFVSFLTTTLYF